MSSLALAAAPSGAAHPHHPWRRAARASWVVHRTTFLVLGALFVALAAGIVVRGLSVHRDYTQFMAKGCLGHATTKGCPQLLAAVGSEESFLSNMAVLLHLVPLVAGVFIGAPLISREIESSSFRFTWTQGMGRLRFELRRYLLLTGSIVVIAVVLGLLIGWLAHPIERVGLTSHWDATLFDTTPLVLPAWAFFSMAAGTLIGLAVGRTVSAMAMTAVPVGGLLAFGAIPRFGGTPGLIGRVLQLGPPVARSKHYLPAQPWNEPSQGVGFGPRGSWLVRSWVTTPRGRVLSPTQAFVLLGHHRAQLQHYRFWYSYQPADRYWTFEAIFALALVIVGALFVVALVQLLRRHG